ncbi:hypothetical protein ACIBSV_49250 [Embleya sp. NPDC050154]
MTATVLRSLEQALSGVHGLVQGVSVAAGRVLVTAGVWWIQQH